MVLYVAYYRVSTARQGKSGLGLAAQKRKVDDFLSNGQTLIGEFCDVQSDRDDARCELQKALALARRHSAKTLIARLDRFSRRVSCKRCPAVTSGGKPDIAPKAQFGRE
jgi:DNA invertase Pin-like site-specific DNA recombinase